MNIRIICCFNGIKKYIVLDKNLSFKDNLDLIKIKMSIPSLTNITMVHKTFDIHIEYLEDLRDNDVVEINVVSQDQHSSYI